MRIAEAKLPAYKKLWELTISTSPARLNNLTIKEREALINKLRDWYYQKGQGLFLSENTRTLYLKAKGALKSKDLDKRTEEYITEVFSDLRKALKTDIKIGTSLITDFIELTSDGKLKIRKNYAWNGPQGPTVDTQSLMRGSLVHDALYQLMRNNYIDSHKNREYADMLFKKIIEQDGVSKFRSWMLYKGLREFGHVYAYSKRKPTYGFKYKVMGVDSDYQDYIERV